jgi:hypothetical protein
MIPFATQNIPNDGTAPTGMTENTIVGYYEDAGGVENGFIATVPEPTALVLLLVGAVGDGP